MIPFDGMDQWMDLLKMIGMFVLILIVLRWLWGVWKRFSLRNTCPCLGRILRRVGYDRFDTFELSVVVHRVENIDQGAMATQVHVSAGQKTARTQESSKGDFHDTLMLQVEQGVAWLTVDLVKTKGSAILASTKIDVADKILNSCSQEKGGAAGIYEERFRMSRKGSRVRLDRDPVVVLTLIAAATVSERTHLLKGTDLETGDISTEYMQQLVKAKAAKREKVKQEKARSGEESNTDDVEDEEEEDPLQLLAETCRGPVEKTVGVWGSRKLRYLKVYKDPSEGWYLGWWESRVQCDKGQAPKNSLRMMTVTSVDPDKALSDDFVLRYATQKGSSSRTEMRLRAVDRSRGVWVEALRRFIILLRKDRSKKQATKKSKRARADDDSQPERTPNKGRGQTGFSSDSSARGRVFSTSDEE